MSGGDPSHAPASPGETLDALLHAARDAQTTAARLAACRGLGALAGREGDAPWEIAERAAFGLLEVARDTDAPAERVGLLSAMGRAFRNVWLVPYVHSRLSDSEESVVVAAILAAGGLAFPALEETLASEFLPDDVRPNVRLAAISALGRMGAESAATRLVPFVTKAPREARAALSALMEIRSRAGEEAALAVLAHDPPRDVLVAAARYLAEMGRAEVLATLRTLARDDDAELRIMASLASRAYKAETRSDPDERILVALTERDRAVRAALARRLRTLPVASVLQQVELLLADDPSGVVQIVSEVRAPDVTRFLLRVAEDESFTTRVRAGAAGAIEADEPWERDALVALCTHSRATEVRIAAARTIGAFAPPAYVIEHLSPLAEDSSPDVRGAFLWALQFAARPGKLAGADRARAEAIVRRALGDTDEGVRRRAAYVAGNLDATSLVPDLVELARKETERPDLRVAAFVALGDVGSTARFADIVHLFNKEDDPDALGAASRALEKTTGTIEPPHSGSTQPPSERQSQPPPSLTRVQDRLPKLFAAKDARVRAAAARVAGLLGAQSEPLAQLVSDPSPRVREQAVIALGRTGGANASVVEAAIVRALSDVDLAIQERAAEALLALGTPSALARAVELAARTFDRAAALRLVARFPAQPTGDEVLRALGEALPRIPHDDPVYEPLLSLKVAVLESARPADKPRAADVETTITALFPAWKELSQVRGFAPLARSLRTAETLHADAAGGADADLSAAIVLFMKCMEGYMHAWLGPRMRSLQEHTGVLLEVADKMLGPAWSPYQKWLGERWPDNVKVGEVAVEVPLRTMTNALRDIQERRQKSYDSPPSVTEWARLMLFFAVDHASGAKNLLKVTTDAARTVRVVHSLSVLAQVRNVVTHRAAAEASTVSAFRKNYYAAFQELTLMA